MGDHDLRSGGVNSARLDVADATGLPQQLLKIRNRGCAGCRGDCDSSDDANAGVDAVHRWLRIDICRPGFPLCLYHDRLWRGLRLSLFDCFGDDAENARPRSAYPRYRLWRDDNGNDGCVDGDDRGMRVATG